MTKRTRGSSAAKKKITYHEAKMYLNEIKDAFKDEKQKYYEFLRVLKDFEKRRIDLEGVVARVKEFFQGHDELLLKFQTFLPDGFVISIPPKKRKVITKEFALKYISKVKTRFRRNPQVYESFLDIMQMFKNDHKSAKELHQTVISIFQGHQDLIDEFTHFLP